jgi:Skp family chaperone for outer membrane proteins
MSRLLAKGMVQIERIEAESEACRVVFSNLEAAVAKRAKQLDGVEAKLDRILRRMDALEDSAARQAASVGALQLEVRRHELVLEQHLAPVPPLRLPQPPSKRARRGA